MPLSSAEIFSEAIGIVPLIHARQRKAIAVVGNDAASAGLQALRFPETQAVYTVNAAIAARDRRIAGLPPTPPSLDVVSIAVHGLPLDLIASYRPSIPQHGLVCLALESPAQLMAAKDGLRKLFRYLRPFRVYLPEPSWFFLASDLPIDKQGSVPKYASHLSDQYLPVLFTFSKDEVGALFGPGGQKPPDEVSRDRALATMRGQRA